MSRGAYQRGSRLVAREADARVKLLDARIERQALKDENARLRLRVERLEHDLGRARRCISAERFAREQRVNELKSELRASHFGVTTLCRIAFGKAEG